MNLQEIFSFLPIELRDRIISKCRIEGNCIIWLGAITKSTGYGKIKYQYHCHDVHRLIARFIYGKLKTENEICHTRDCEFKACINPNHLYNGTRSSNMIDAKVKGTLYKPWLNRD